MGEKTEKLNEVVKNELSKIIAKEIDLPPGVFLTITEAETSEDSSESKIFISVFPENKISEVLKILNREIYGLQQILNKRIKIRFVPKIRFLEDKRLKEAQKIDTLLESIEKKD